MENKISIVIPAYNEELVIEKAYKEIKKVLAKIGADYEIIFVDDGSTDNTWEEIKKLHKAIGLKFSRNFGKESAIYAGLAKSSGDVVAVMDCDLQHPPETLIEMYKLWEQGFQVIEGVKESRGKESKVHSKCSELFYNAMSVAMKVDMKNTSDFKMLDRQVVDAILKMPERNMFFRATSSWVGFNKI